MTRILYGIQGTGNGHLARARALVPALRNMGMEIDFIFTGRDREDYFNMELFDDFRTFSGLSLITERGQLKSWKTMTQNSFLGFLGDINKLELRKYDFVLSDFEPLTAWAAKKNNVPSLGISHQCAFSHQVPKVGGYWGSKLLMKAFAPTSSSIGLHWYHFDQPILPPLIEPHETRPTVDRKIVVYMGFEDVGDIIDFVKPFTDYQFNIYSRVSEPQQYGSIHVKPISHEEFHRDLTDCSGVISNAGFELSSECLALGKKLLLKPLLGQYEQLCNSLAMQALNRATIIKTLDSNSLERWLQIGNHEPIHYPDVAAGIAQWIDSGMKESIQELSNSMWASCDFPLNYDHRFGSSLRPDLVF